MRYLFIITTTFIFSFQATAGWVKTENGAGIIKIRKTNEGYTAYSCADSLSDAHCTALNKTPFQGDEITKYGERLLAKIVQDNQTNNLINGARVFDEETWQKIAEHKGELKMKFTAPFDQTSFSVHVHELEKRINANKLGTKNEEIDLEQCKTTLQIWLKNSMDRRRSINSYESSAIKEIAEGLRKDVPDRVSQNVLELNDELALKESIADKLIYCESLKQKLSTLIADTLRQVKAYQTRGKFVPENFINSLEEDRKNLDHNSAK